MTCGTPGRFTAVQDGDRIRAGEGSGCPNFARLPDELSLWL